MMPKPCWIHAPSCLCTGHALHNFRGHACVCTWMHARGDAEHTAKQLSVGHALCRLLLLIPPPPSPMHLPTYAPTRGRTHVHTPPPPPTPSPLPPQPPVPPPCHTHIEKKGASETGPGFRNCPAFRNWLPGFRNWPTGFRNWVLRSPKLLPRLDSETAVPRIPTLAWTRKGSGHHVRRRSYAGSKATAATTITTITTTSTTATCITSFATTTSTAGTIAVTAAAITTLTAPATATAITDTTTFGH